MPNTFGQSTRPTILLKTESHKLHEEFEVQAGSTIRYSQPVKLNTDGTVSPLEAGDNRNLCIGYSIHNSDQNIYGNGRVTVALKGYTKILCQAAGAVNAGPVKLAAAEFNSIVGPPETNGKFTGASYKDEPWYGLNVVEAATGPTDVAIIGHAIEQAADGETVEVIFF